MTIAVLANEEQWDELGINATGINWERITSLHTEIPLVDGYIILQEINQQQLANIKKPLILNSVAHTLKELQTGTNVVRINGWNSFLKRNVWEVSGIISDEVKQIFSAVNKQYIEAADEAGLVAARVIAMIINEAYFTLGEEVSSKEEIDTAMKLGTNYPFGPCEWVGIIGAKNVYDLLLVLSRQDKRYLPAPLLQKEASL
jgi:3-hydroxybutyryl-CoA dehydrogenase